MTSSPMPTRRYIAAFRFATALLIATPVAAATQIKEPKSPGGPAVVRLINEKQYISMIANIFGEDIKNAVRFPPTRRVEGLVNLGTGTADVTPSQLNLFEEAGRSIAAQVVDEKHRENLIHCTPRDVAKPDEACARTFLGSVGRLLFRRSLTQVEMDYWTQTANLGAEKFADFYAGLKVALSGMLVAPQFVFLAEAVDPHPNGDGTRQLGGPSKALRLSLLLWDAPPDALLIDAAESGKLDTASGLRREVDRMIASPRFRNGVRAFFEDMLIMESFENLSKDPTLYPAYTVKAATEAREQMLHIIDDHLVTRKADYRDLFTTRHIFLTSDLGALYKVPVNAKGALAWQPYELPEDDPRAGILMQAGFLSVNSHPGRSSSTKRGKALREIFMCQRVPDPPPNVDFSLVEDPNSPIATARDRLSAHSTHPVCGGCHKIMDPMGLAMEQFDAAGQFRTTEHGVAIDTSGDLNGVKFKDAKGLAQAVRNNPAITSCVVEKLYKYGTARPIARDEKPVLAYLKDRFAAEDYNFVELMKTIATSKAFYAVQQEQVASADSQ